MDFQTLTALATQRAEWGWMPCAWGLYADIYAEIYEDEKQGLIEWLRDRIRITEEKKLSVPLTVLASIAAFVQQNTDGTVVMFSADELDQWISDEEKIVISLEQLCPWKDAVKGYEKLIQSLSPCQDGDSKRLLSQITALAVKIAWHDQIDDGRSTAVKEWCQDWAAFERLLEIFWGRVEVLPSRLSSKETDLLLSHVYPALREISFYAAKRAATAAIEAAEASCPAVAEQEIFEGQTRLRRLTELAARIGRNAEEYQIPAYGHLAPLFPAAATKGVLSRLEESGDVPYCVQVDSETNTRLLHRLCALNADIPVLMEQYRGGLEVVIAYPTEKQRANGQLLAQVSSV